MKLFSILFLAVIAMSNASSGQTVIGNYYDAENQVWHLVEIRPTSGDVRELGNIDELASLYGAYSFVVDSKKNTVNFFGYDFASRHRFYTVSINNAKVISFPEIDDAGGWQGLTLNQNDSLLYVMKGVFDGLGTDLVRFVNSTEGVYEYVQHLDLEIFGQPAISKENIVVSQGVEYYIGTFDGKYYTANTDILDSLQSFDVLCDYIDPAFIRDMRYYPNKDAFFGLRQRDVNSNFDYDLVSIDPSTAQTLVVGDLGGYTLSNSGGGILFDAGYYIFTGNYVGDTIQRVFSVDIETGEVVNDPALSLQVQIRGIDVDQNSLVGIAETSESARAIKVFPNPASESIHFEVDGRAEYQVMDVFGKVLFQGNAKTNEQVALDVSSLAVGVYYLRAENSSASFVIAW